MKSKLSPTDLSRELRKFSTIAKSRSTIPILDNVLFNFKKKSVSLTVTDLEVTYITSLNCDSDVEFDVTIPYSEISEIASKLSGLLVLSVNDNLVTLICDNAKFKLSINGSPNEFPTTPDEEFEFEDNVDGDFFYHLSNANSCRNKDLLRVSQNMASISIKSKVMDIVGTDSFSLYRKSFDVAYKKELSVMVPEKFITACKSFQDSKLYIGSKYIKVVYGEDTVIGLLGANKFVDYRVILPKEVTYNLDISKGQILPVLSRLSVVSDFKTKQCAINFNHHSIRLSSVDVDFGKDGEETIPLENRVGFESISLSADLFHKIISITDGEELEMSFESENRMVFIRGKNDLTQLCLVMPIHNQAN